MCQTEKRRLMIYVAGPYSADTQAEVDANVAAAERAARYIWDSGHVAICPHKNTLGFEAQSYDDDRPYDVSDFEKFLPGDFEIIARCDAVFFVGQWHQSTGAMAELAFARYVGVPCIFNLYVELGQFLRLGAPDGR